MKTNNYSAKSSLRSWAKALTLLFAMATPSCTWAQANTVEVNISNPTNEQRQELVEVELKTILGRLGISDVKKQPFTVKNKIGQQADFQLTHDGKLLIDASVRPNANVTYYIMRGKPMKQKVWTTGAYYQMRKDDIAWENDRCAYRVYGPALQRSGEQSRGTDVWAKSTPDTVVYKRYWNNQDGWMLGNKLRQQAKKAKTEKQRKALLAKADSVHLATSFHLEHGDGLDPYRVGATLGLGAPALMAGDSIVLPYCYKDYQILDNGPLRFTVALTYNPSDIGAAKNVVEHRIISLDKGSNFNKMTVWYTGLTEPTDFATGFPIHEEDTEWKTIAADYLSYADPTDNMAVNNAQLYVAVLFPEKIDQTFYQLFKQKHDGATGHALGIRKGLKDGERYNYYFGAGWSKYDVRSYAEWQLRINQFMRALKTPLTVSVN